MAYLAAAAAHVNVPPRLQAPPQLGNENDADQRTLLPQRVVRRWFSAACVTLGCSCRASWNGAPGQKCCKKCGPEHQCSQQFGGGPNHGGGAGELDGGADAEDEGQAG